MTTTTLPDATVVATHVQTGMFAHRWTPEYRDAPLTDVTWKVKAGRKTLTGTDGPGVTGQLPVMPDMALAQKPGTYTVTWTLTRADDTSDTYTQKVRVVNEHPE